MKAAFTSARSGRLEDGEAFSLIEVVIALGIASFVLVAIIGLVPVGLRNISDAREQARAVTAVNELAISVAGATNQAGTYQALAPFNTLIQWKDTDTSKTFGPFYMDENDNPNATAGGARLAVALRLMRSGTANAPWNFYICVAWPAPAKSLKWSGTKLAMTNQQGYVDTVLLLDAP